MKVKIIRNSFRDCPPNLKTSGFSEDSIVNLKEGDFCQVFAMSIFSGVVFVLLKDQYGIFTWLPSWLFEVIESDMPDYWVTNFFDDDPSCLIGPEFMASDLDAYSRLVEQDPELVAKMNELIADI